MNDWGPYIVVFILALVFLYLVVSLLPKSPPKKRFDWLDWMDEFEDDEPMPRRGKRHGKKNEEEPAPKPNFWKVRY